jgi:hypothetical protein
MKPTWIAALLVAAFAGPTTAQTITGTVVDTTSNTPVAVAQVLLLQDGSSSTSLTDSAGKFRFSAKPGVFMLQFSALGYSELHSDLLLLRKNENLTVLAFLTTVPIELPPVFVVGRSRRPLNSIEQFEQRRKRGGFGYFLDEKAIDRIPAMFVSDIMKHVPGARPGRDNVSLRPDCEDAIYLVDGIQIRPLRSDMAADYQSATDIVNGIVSVSDIAAIEIYKGDAGVPGELSFAVSDATGGMCGIIAIWTKR